MIIQIDSFTLTNNDNNIFNFIIKEFGNNVEDVPAENIIVDDIYMAFEQEDFGEILKHVWYLKAV